MHQPEQQFYRYSRIQPSSPQILLPQNVKQRVPAPWFHAEQVHMTLPVEAMENFMQIMSMLWHHQDVNSHDIDNVIRNPSCHPWEWMLFTCTITPYYPV